MSQSSSACFCAGLQAVVAPSLPSRWQYSSCIVWMQFTSVTKLKAAFPWQHHGFKCLLFGENSTGHSPNRGTISQSGDVKDNMKYIDRGRNETVCAANDGRNVTFHRFTDICTFGACACWAQIQRRLEQKGSFIFLKKKQKHRWREVKVQKCQIAASEEFKAGWEMQHRE